MRLVFAAGILLSLCAVPAFAQDTPIKVSGCVVKGVEPGCLALRAAHNKFYNISAAEPKPAPGTFGTVTGTLRPHWISFCQQGPIISPASFRAGPVLCLKTTKKKK